MENQIVLRDRFSSAQETNWVAGNSNPVMYGKHPAYSTITLAHFYEKCSARNKYYFPGRSIIIVNNFSMVFFFYQKHRVLLPKTLKILSNRKATRVDLFKQSQQFFMIEGPAEVQKRMTKICNYCLSPSKPVFTRFVLIRGST